jgi:hypothetical protein
MPNPTIFPPLTVVPVVKDLTRSALNKKNARSVQPIGRSGVYQTTADN